MLGTQSLCKLTDHGDLSAGFHKYLEAFLLNVGRKPNVHKAFRRRAGDLLNVLCSFNLRLASKGRLMSRVLLVFLLRSIRFLL